MYHQDDRRQALDRAIRTIEAAGPKGEEPPKVNPDVMRSYGDIVNSADPVDRLARYINGLSPHNLWKAKAAIEEYVETQNAQTVREARLDDDDLFNAIVSLKSFLERRSDDLQAFCNSGKGMYGAIIELLEELAKSYDARHQMLNDTYNFVPSAAVTKRRPTWIKKNANIS